MVGPISHLPCYLVEWYRPQLTAVPLDETVARLNAAAQALGDEGSTVRLIITLAAPSDEVLYGVFVATSLAAVIAACQRAEYPAERVTSDVDARIVVDQASEFP